MNKIKEVWIKRVGVEELDILDPETARQQILDYLRFAGYGISRSVVDEDGVLYVTLAREEVLVNG